jgi:hypothetical protein
VNVSFVMGGVEKHLLVDKNEVAILAFSSSANTVDILLGAANSNK